VAGFVGLANVLTGAVEAAGGDELSLRLTNGAICTCPPIGAPPLRLGATASVAVRPENVRLAKGQTPPPLGAPMGLQLTGTVTAAVFTGNLIDYFVHLDGTGEVMRVQSLPPRLAGQGDQVSLAIAARDCILLED
jgi:ABC-type Fe3+/spermidine/putrescine transport system ATPase subunit